MKEINNKPSNKHLSNKHLLSQETVKQRIYTTEKNKEFGNKYLSSRERIMKQIYDRKHYDEDLGLNHFSNYFRRVYPTLVSAIEEATFTSEEKAVLLLKDILPMREYFLAGVLLSDITLSNTLMKRVETLSASTCIQLLISLCNISDETYDESDLLEEVHDALAVGLVKRILQEKTQQTYYDNILLYVCQFSMFTNENVMRNIIIHLRDVTKHLDTYPKEYFQYSARIYTVYKHARDKALSLKCPLLVTAVEKDMDELVGFLLKRKYVNPNVRNELGEACLTIAAKRDNPLIFQMLLAAGANWQTVNMAHDKRTLIGTATLHHSSNVLKMILANQLYVSLHYADALYNTLPLLWAKGLTIIHPNNTLTQNIMFGLRDPNARFLVFKCLENQKGLSWEEVNKSGMDIVTLLRHYVEDNTIESESWYNDNRIYLAKITFNKKMIKQPWLHLTGNTKLYIDKLLSAIEHTVEAKKAAVFNNKQDYYAEMFRVLLDLMSRFPQYVTPWLKRHTHVKAHCLRYFFRIQGICKDEYTQDHALLNFSPLVRNLIFRYLPCFTPHHIRIGTYVPDKLLKDAYAKSKFFNHTNTMHKYVTHWVNDKPPHQDTCESQKEEIKNSV